MTAVHVVPLGDTITHTVPGGLDGHDTAPARAWLVLEADPGSDPHVDDTDCPCGPTAELLYGPDGDGWLVTHHSLDGREQREKSWGPTA